MSDASKFISRKTVTIAGEPVIIRRLPLAAGVKAIALLAPLMEFQTLIAMMSGASEQILGVMKTFMSGTPELVELLFTHGVEGGDIDWMNTDWDLSSILLLEIIEFNKLEDVIHPLLTKYREIFPKPSDGGRKTSGN